jgi:methanogenic corrinoid protein MtbC1
MDIQQSLIERIHQGDRGGANALLDAWASEHGYERLLAEVLDPALLLIGEEWNSSETFTLAQVYVAAKVTEDVLSKTAAQRISPAEGQPPKGPVVIGNIEEDFHALGRRMVGTFLRAEGWIVHDLGCDVPAALFVDKAQELGARVIGVSAMMMTTARNVKRVREEIDRRSLTGRMQLAVGGAVFNVCPGLAEEVGGDGTASNALGAAGLFDRLWEQSVNHDNATSLMQEMHRKLVYLDTGLTPAPETTLKECAAYCGLPFEVRPVSLERLRLTIEEALLRCQGTGAPL